MKSKLNISKIPQNQNRFTLYKSICLVLLAKKEYWNNEMDSIHYHGYKNIFDILYIDTISNEIIRYLNLKNNLFTLCVVKNRISRFRIYIQLNIKLIRLNICM